MVNVTIYKKHSFIEYLGPTVSISSLSGLALSNIDKILGISEDNDHLIVFSPNNNYNELTLFETNKKYLIIANSDYPKFVLYSYSNVTPTVTPTNTLTPTPTISLTPTPTITPTPPIAWVARSLPVTTFWKTVTNDNLGGPFIGIPSSSNTLISSYDSINWETMPYYDLSNNKIQSLLPSTASWIDVKRVVKFNNNYDILFDRFIAIENYSIAIADSENFALSEQWRSVSLPLSSQYLGIWNFQCIACSIDDTCVVLSSDSFSRSDGLRSVDGGATWIKISNIPDPVDLGLSIASGGGGGGGGPRPKWSSMAWGNNRFIAVAKNGGSKLIMSLNEGITWTESNLPSGYYNKIKYCKNNFFLLKDYEFSSGSTNTIKYSPDGILWSTMTLPITDTWFDIASDFNGDLMILGGTKSLLSRDGGNTWIELNMPILPVGRWNSLAVADGIFVAFPVNSNNIAASYGSRIYYGGW
jgi:hypothetical protein